MEWKLDKQSLLGCGIITTMAPRRFVLADRVNIVINLCSMRLRRFWQEISLMEFDCRLGLQVCCKMLNLNSRLLTLPPTERYRPKRFEECYKVLRRHWGIERYRL